MFKFLSYKNWSKLQLDETGYSYYVEQKRNILFSQFCVLAMIGALIQAGYDLYDGFPYVMMIDLLIVLVLFAGYLLNEKNKHRIAKIMVFLFSNLMLFAFAAVVPKDVGIYLLFFPLVAFSFIVYDYKERTWSLLFAAFAILLNAVLLITGYQPFGAINLQPSDPTLSFALNFIISIVLLSLGIDFLLKINYQAEQNLLQSHEKASKLAKEISTQNEQLEKTNEELDSFVYSTSHDLRAPLSSIQGLITIAQMENPSPVVDKYLRLMKDRILNLDNFIQDIIDYSRNARMSVHYQQVNLHDLIEEVLTNNKYLDESNQIELVKSIDAPETVKLDKTRTYRILNNLVSNAIKYNNPGTDKPFVKITAITNTETLELKVKDSGIGIESHKLDKIFDMFYRGTENAKGSGLGLYIAKEMVSKMNGTIEVTSEERKGSEFRITLPIK
jgi:signal transduction histidine kinase